MGQKTVEFTIHTDSPRTPEIRLRLRMVSRRDPPYLSGVRGDLTFTGEIKAGDDAEVVVRTMGLDESGREPDIKVDIPYMKINLIGKASEPLIGTPYHNYTYRYKVVFAEAPPPEVYAGVLTVVDPWDGGHIKSLRINISQSSGIRTYPRRLALNLKSAGDTDAEARFIVRGGGHGAAYRVNGGPELDSPFVLEPVDSESDGEIATVIVRLKPGVVINEGEYRLTVSSREGRVSYSNHIGEDWRRGMKRRSGMTLIELLVAIGIIGILAGLLLPAVQSAREASRQFGCANALRQISLACHSYASSWGGMPPGGFEKSSKTPSVVATPCMPACWRIWICKLCIRVSTSASRPLFLIRWPSEIRLRSDSSIMSFVCPSDPMVGIGSRGAVSHRMNAGLCSKCSEAGSGAFVFGRQMPYAEVVDGLSNTLAFSEKPIGSGASLHHHSEIGRIIRAVYPSLTRRINGEPLVPP